MLLTSADEGRAEQVGGGDSSVLRVVCGLNPIFTVLPIDAPDEGARRVEIESSRGRDAHRG